jgi:hypothetical protein
MNCDVAGRDAMIFDRSPLFELSSLLARFDHVASRIVDHNIM